MKIKNQVLISIIAFVIVVSVITVSIIVTEQQTAQLNSRATTALNIQTGASALGYISSNYFLYQDNSSVTLWQTEFSTLSNELAQLNSTNPEQRTLVNNVNNDLQNLNAVFADTQSFLESAPRNVSVRVLPVFQTDWSRIAVQNQALAFDAQQLTQYLRNQVDQANSENIFLIVALLGLFGAYFIANYLITYFSALKSLSKLQAGIAVIGSGDLDYSLKTDKNDEISEISRSFNQMAVNLREVTASKADLEKEIVERKKAEEELEQYKNDLEKIVEERTRQLTEQAQLLDKAHEAISVRDLEGKIIYWNKGAERMYGWTSSEALGRKITELVKDQAQYGNALKELVSEGEWGGELKVAKDGKDMIIDSHWTLVDGELKQIMAIDSDITERKSLETQLLRAQRLESLGTLAGGIAHDIRNIITPVTLGLDMLDKKVADEEDHMMVALLQKNLQRGTDLTKQILTFARGTEIERKPIEIPKLVYDVEKILKETFPKTITVEKQSDSNISVIEGDSSQLHQVLINLCINARDAMPYGGRLNIIAKNETVDEHFAAHHPEAKAGQYASIEIADSGIGMRPEVMERLFEPFFTTKKQGEGTGLGLSTARSIVKSHGGFINVYSEVGKGSSFKLYLPAAKPGSDQQPEGQAASLIRGSGQTVLVVDDEELIRMTAIAALQSNGYRALGASDGAEALSVYVQNDAAIKIVLLDMSMPLMDGEATMRALRKISPGLKIIGMSGLMDSGKYETTLDMANAFISKPFTAEKLLRMIANEIKE